MEFEETCTEMYLKTENEKPNDVFIEIEIPFSLYQYLGSESWDLQKLCRICLAVEPAQMFPLLTTKDASMLANMFTSITSIQVDVADGLPSQICSTCHTLVIQCYEFKSQCEKADYTLRSVLKGEFVIKQETNIKNEGSFTEGNKLHSDELVIKEEPEFSESSNLNSKSTENLIDNSKEQESLYFIKENDTEEKNIEVSITDSKTLLNKLLSEKYKNKNKQRKVFRCALCTKKFLKLSLLKEHRKVEHKTESQLYSCDNCKDLFNSEHDLKLHLSLHTKGPMWKCSKCNKQFNGKPELRRHIKRHMESKKYSCDNCDKTFVELYALRRHMRVHTGEIVEKKHACHLCDKRYTESGALATHLRQHSGDRPCVCATCGKTFPSQRLLSSHSLVHSDNKPYGCKYCDKRFRHESTRNAHQRLHTGEKPYVCSACGKTFVQASNLTLHMRTHTGERPYQCPDCGRRFTSGSSLKSHLRTHTGERPFTCNVCGKNFASQNLRIHMRQHNGERPHECQACDKKFVNAARLKQHVRTHTGEKPFECTICSSQFLKKNILKAHMKSHLGKNKNLNRNIIVNPKIAETLKLAENTSEEIAQELLINDDSQIETNIILLDHSHINEDDIKLNGEIPFSVDKELVIQDDNSVETNILVVDSIQNDDKLNRGNTVHILNDINYTNDMKLVTVNEGEVSIASSGLVDAGTVKLYQLDQSLVQIHSSDGHVTISKITSKMTANF